MGVIHRVHHPVFEKSGEISEQTDPETRAVVGHQVNGIGSELEVVAAGITEPKVANSILFENADGAD